MSGQKKQILFCWEWGGGSGHLEGFGEIARCLSEGGHNVAFATRNICVSRRFQATSQLRLIQAPLFWPPSNHSRAVSFADMLVKFGYERTNELCAVIDAWGAIFERERPDVILCEHSPTALIAGRVFEVSTAIQGTGFTVPPHRSPMPGFLSTDDSMKKHLLCLEGRAVNAINRALKRYSASSIESLADLYPSNRCYLLTYQELDHFAERGTVDYYGTPCQTDTGEMPVWPHGKSEKVFVYMHPEYPQFAVMLKQLAHTNYRVLVVAPGVDHGIVERSGATNIRIQEELVNLEAVAEQCRIVICHASHGTVAQVLRLGIAPIVTPNYVEQIMLARRLASGHLGFSAFPDPRRHNYSAMIRTALGANREASCVAEFAKKYPPSLAQKRFSELSNRFLLLA